MASNLLFPTLMLTAGIGIPVMAALNSHLGAKLGSSALATALLFFVGFTLSFAFLLKTEGVSGNIFRANIPWYFYLGGLLVAFYVLSVTWVAPQYGVGNAISFVLLGQLIAISLIDHYGLLGAQQSLLDGKRLLGLAMMVSGVFLVIKRSA
ncbi:DMT family transporter [Rheinheimera sp. 1928-s]|uniref:DMT family transporter n=1 Tax=Rheinheimera sp. 1928-s TaxID=3033803 RepID=UPI00260D2AF5|nr:DMT family transporter [Rheinheimera sp. 1928-s]MDF3124173.1 DMT family transporter [Rheinheimera sp. 1928-s]